MTKPDSGYPRPSHRDGFPAFLSFLVVLFSITVQAQSRPLSNSPPLFVKRCGSEFCRGDSTFYFAGTNVYDFFTYGDGGSDQDSLSIETRYMDKVRIDAHMARLAKDQVTVVRLWAFSHETWHGFEPTKGVYPEAQFRQFDYILESARRHGILLIPTLENYWEAYGGIDTRLKWEGIQGGHPGRWRFFNRKECADCFDSFKAYLARVVNRVNHYSGLAYKDDPVIFAWDLMNEPRYQDAVPDENKTGTTLRAWVDEMAGYVKSLDRNHMVGVGLEAHESRYGFGGDEGNPFLVIHASPHIDFTSAHPYPTEHWAHMSIDQTRTLVRTWIRESRDQLGKPIFIGEFNAHNGNTHGTRADWWRGIYAEIEAQGGNGSGFWWYPDRNNDPNFGVSEGSAELAVFREHSLHMQARKGKSSLAIIALPGRARVGKSPAPQGAYRRPGSPVELKEERSPPRWFSLTGRRFLEVLSL